MISDGPVTTEGLDSFSLSDLIAEVRQVAPSFFSLLCDLGDVRRNADEADTLTQNKLKSLMSLCVLANARSRQTKGVQLHTSLPMQCCKCGFPLSQSKFCMPIRALKNTLQALNCSTLSKVFPPHTFGSWAVGISAIQSVRSGHCF